MKFALIAVLVTACSPTVSSTTSTHPASAAAPVGRLAGPPSALRPGVADAADAPAEKPSSGHNMPGHDMPGHDMPPKDSSKPPGAHTMPTPDKPEAHEHSSMPVDDDRPAKKPAKKPAGKKPAANKPSAKPPAEKPPAEKAPAEKPPAEKPPAMPPGMPPGHKMTTWPGEELL